MEAAPAPGKLVTIQRHIVEEQSLHPEATGELTALLWDLFIAIKIISREVNKAGLADILGMTESRNVYGERVSELDRFSQERIEKAMDHGGHLCAMASEESKDLIRIPERFRKGKYVMVFDPLDGSSNVGANVSVGTIFAIHRRRSPGEGDGTLDDLLRPGREAVAAGYVIYGPSTMLVYSTGSGAHGFTLDPSIGEFLLSHPDIRIPARGSQYSINEGHAGQWDEGTRAYVASLKREDKARGTPYSLRYIGSMVADVHRTLLYGGVFLYPLDVRDPSKPKAKLRLLYEANPMAFIVEQAGGLAYAGDRRVLDIEPESLHHRVPLAIGSPDDVREYLAFPRRGGATAG